MNELLSIIANGGFLTVGILVGIWLTKHAFSYLTKEFASIREENRQLREAFVAYHKKIVLLDDEQSKQRDKVKPEEVV